MLLVIICADSLVVAANLLRDSARTGPMARRMVATVPTLRSGHANIGPLAKASKEE